MKALIGLLLAKEATARTAFKPIFHTPNDFDAEGNPCSDQKPTVTQTCPVFCVNMYRNSQFIGSAELNTLCGQPCEVGEVLLPTGECGACNLPDDNEGRLTCGGIGFDESDNPCYVFGEESQDDSYYRPCTIVDTNVDHYYKGDDMQSQMIMTSCAEDRGIDEETTLTLKKGEIYTVPFPVLTRTDETRSWGFGQPPNSPAAPYPYNTPGWIFLFTCIVLAPVLCILFEIYKAVREKGILEAEKSLTGSSVSIHSYKTREDASSAASGDSGSKNRKEIGGSDTTQVGYLDDWFGFLTFWYLIFFAVLQQLWLFVLVMDVYGFFWWACDDATKNYCTCANNGTNCAPGQDPDSITFYSFRDGFSCGFACLIGYHNINGVNDTWPYFPVLPNNAHYKIVFIASWHLIVAYFVVLRLFKTKLRSHYRIRCVLEKATTVLISEPAQKAIEVENEKHTFIGQIGQMVQKWERKLMGPPVNTEEVHVQNDKGGSFFDFRCQRFSWNTEELSYVRSNVCAGDTHADIIANKEGLSSDEVLKRQGIGGKNIIRVDVPSWARSYFHETFDWFYFYQFFGIWIAMHFVWWTFGLTYLIIVIVSSILTVRITRLAKMRIKEIAETTAEVDCLRDGKWKSFYTDELVPGDVVAIHSGPIVCDVAIIEGRCVVDESSLTGEPNPVPKIPLEPHEKPYTKAGEDAKFTLYSGTSCQATTAGPSGKTLGVVVSTGSHTDKGRLVRNILYPAPMTFKFDQHWKVVFVLLMFKAVIVMILIFWLINWGIDAWYYGMATALQILSPLLPASFTMAQSRASQNLKNMKEKIFCINMQRTAVAGKVKIACFDKTGTLTTSGLEYRGVAAVDGEDLMETSKDLEDYDLLQKALATCHELDFTAVDSDEKQLIGNEVDKNMFLGTGFEFHPEKNMTVRKDDMQLKTLRRFEFDRATMTSSVIVEEKSTKERYIFTKGSPDRVKDICVQTAIPDGWNKEIDTLGRQGVYVLGVSWKKYEGPEDASKEPRTVLEKDMYPLGILQFSNQLKEETADVIQELKEGSIRCVMITGDSAETGVKIARECGLSVSSRVFVAKTKSNKSKDQNLNNIYWYDYDTMEVIDDIYKFKDELESNEVELCVTGKAMAILRVVAVPLSFAFWEASPSQAKLNIEEQENFRPDSQLEDILRYVRVFARVKPDQKVQAVELNMKQGITTMCGDGANDAAALQRSHAGMALASGTGGDEAALVAHFSTTSEDLRCFVKIVREGRSSLATMIHLYKFLMAYGQSLVCLSFIEYYLNAISPEAYWLFLDTFLSVSTCIAILQSKPAKRLLPYRPTSRLLGWETCSSLIIHIVNNYIWTISLIALLFAQPWFKCQEWDANLYDPGKWWLKGDNYESYTLTLICMIQISCASSCFNFGFDFRRSWIVNFWVPVVTLFWIIFYMLIALLEGRFWPCLFRSNCGDNTVMKWWGTNGGWFNDGTTMSFNFDENKNINVAPDGCSCYDQYEPPEVAFCTSEYVDCPSIVSQWNATFHHTIVPNNWRWTLVAFCVGNVVTNLLLEGIFIVGCVRRKLQANEAKKKDMSRLPIVGGLDKHDPSHQEEKEMEVTTSDDSKNTNDSTDSEDSE